MSEKLRLRSMSVACSTRVFINSSKDILQLRAARISTEFPFDGALNLVDANSSTNSESICFVLNALDHFIKTPQNMFFNIERRLDVPKKAPEKHKI